MHKLYDPPVTLLEICSDIVIPLENDIIYSDIFWRIFSSMVEVSKK